MTQLHSRDLLSLDIEKAPFGTLSCSWGTTRRQVSQALKLEALTIIAMLTVNLCKSARIAGMSYFATTWNRALHRSMKPRVSAGFTFALRAHAANETESCAMPSHWTAGSVKPSWPFRPSVRVKWNAQQAPEGFESSSLCGKRASADTISLSVASALTSGALLDRLAKGIPWEDLLLAVRSAVRHNTDADA